MMRYEQWQIALIALPFCILVVYGLIRFFEHHKAAPLPPRGMHAGSYAPSYRQESDQYAPTDDLQKSESVIDPRWVDLFSILRRCAFAILAGATRSGKTVLAHNLIRARLSEGQKAIIFDPDAQPGHWPGAMVYGAGDDWDQMLQGFALVNALIDARRRYRASKPISDHHNEMLEAAGLSVYSDDLVTIGLIDASDTMQECADQAVDMLKTLARRGAKLGLYLLIDVQDTQAATLNLGGATKVLKNAKLTLEISKDRTGARYCTPSGAESPGPDRLRIPILPAPDDGPRRSSRPNISTGIRPSIAADIPTGISPTNDALRGPEPIHPSNTTDQGVSVDLGPNGGPSDGLEESDPMTLLDPQDQSAKAQRAKKTIEKARLLGFSKNDLAALMTIDRNLAMEVISTTDQPTSAAKPENETSV